MRVACIGNMNNNFFALVRYLRERGVDAHLFRLAGEPEHFSPENDTFEGDWKAYTTTLPFGRWHLDYWRTPAAQIRAAFRGFDVLIGCGSAPAYAHKAGLQLDYFIPYGEDASGLPFFGVRRNARLIAADLLGAPAKLAQRAGIRAARAINNYAPEHPFARAVFARLKPRGRVTEMGIPLVYTPVFNPTYIRHHRHRSATLNAFQQVRDRSDLMVFHHSRHVWKTYINPASWKGNDTLIRGFARFVHSAPSARATLVLLEYGPDVAASKELVEALGIGEHVQWFPRLARKDLAVGLEMSDIAAGTFSTGAMSSGVIYESLAMGKPLLHDRRDSRLTAGAGDLYPVANGRTEEEIAETLADFRRRPAHYQAMGRDGLVWLEEKLIRPAVDRCLEIIGECASGRDRVS